MLFEEDRAEWGETKNACIVPKRYEANEQLSQSLQERKDYCGADSNLGSWGSSGRLPEDARRRQCNECLRELTETKNVYFTLLAFLYVDLSKRL